MRWLLASIEDAPMFTSLEKALSRVRNICESDFVVRVMRSVEESASE
jgi:hypothetical protein